MYIIYNIWIFIADYKLYIHMKNESVADCDSRTMCYITKNIITVIIIK